VIRAGCLGKRYARRIFCKQQYEWLRPLLWKGEME
jgi:hypothetical protein